MNKVTVIISHKYIADINARFDVNKNLSGSVLYYICWIGEKLLVALWRE